jgi:hypothetical protein
MHIDGQTYFLTMRLDSMQASSTNPQQPLAYDHPARGLQVVLQTY